MWSAEEVEILAFTPVAFYHNDYNRRYRANFSMRLAAFEGFKFLFKRAVLITQSILSLAPIRKPVQSHFRS
ncbi:unnamed protein product [Bursaphelenchus xylophilus]|uniref:(pine wood nematode) hypothetical protein n=1 Tax=Bursaphelenchus xylophilus TaxID=6326 RepID=A0A1I7S6Z9_BURXY|nr:unnamed protein product [Bursaphelenchus xylophilus]CAG9079512.1 unnamed protein product [Bursaphelenchus xylophilus]